ncbi:hypothetical protein TELCIR_02200 [Teladorsagia circumcincta]|uniref:C-type lectin domain-containing protein n=1 Tax=Teladorsagia circumcincta TaxID=45464 RepID=A0A2G9UZQ0_TELCI|nr:hypothetical protein TELCIR_02200 [Teladorsagia circumcincta]
MGDYDEAWIGLRRKLLLWNHLEEDQLPMYSAWTWTDGTPVNFFDWAPAQPEKIANSECIQKHYRQGAWSVVDCNKKMKSFVCKFRDFP